MQLVESLYECSKILHNNTLIYFTQCSITASDKPLLSSSIFIIVRAGNVNTVKSVTAITCIYPSIESGVRIVLTGYSEPLHKKNNICSTPASFMIFSAAIPSII